MRGVLHPSPSHRPVRGLCGLSARSRANPLDTTLTPVAAAVAHQHDPILGDFRNFMFLLWQHLGLKAPTDVQYDIALFLQHGPQRRIIQAFRGIGKSWITAAFVLWRLLRNPNERILVVSANEDRAAQFTTFCRRLISEAPFLAHLAPKKGTRDSALAFDVSGSMAHQSPSLRAAGITGQITGGRASLIVPDDVEVPKNSLTQTMRDRLSEAVKEFDAILMSEDDLAHLGLPKGEVVFLGTPQTEATIYRTLEERGYTTRIWPARYPDEKMAALYGERLAPWIRDALKVDPTLAHKHGLEGATRGASVEPRRFPDADLHDREVSYGRSGFALQFMLNPSLADQDRYPLKLSDLIVLDLDPKLAPISLAWAASPELIRQDLPNVGLPGDRLYRPIFVSKENYVPYQGVVLAIDPAGRGSDELGYAIVAMLNGFLFVLRCRGLTGGYSDENLQLLAEEAKRYGVNEVRIESNFGDGMFTKLFLPFLHRIHPCHTEEDRSSQQKERRIIDTLEPVMNQHRLVMDATLIKQDHENYNNYCDETKAGYELLYQMSRITKDKGSLAKDDRLDALAMAVAYWVEVMDKDVQRVEEEHREAARTIELEKFMEAAGGFSRDGIVDCFLNGAEA